MYYKQKTVIGLLLLAGLSPVTSWAEKSQGSDQISDPPLLESSDALAPKAASEANAALPNNLVVPTQEKELAPGIPREKRLNLSIRYVNGWIRNPAKETSGKKVYDKVQLRSYVQGRGNHAVPTEASNVWPVNPNTHYVAPRIETFPGQTVRITLNNDLPRDPSCTNHPADINTPHCFNGTNLHAHGLWVSPTGNSDNVLVKINPGVSFQYEYNIPPDHPAGTFWYHTHLHGSTALQVSSGMAGALIVRGNRAPVRNKHGDLDVLIPKDKFPERVMVFQQIQYACPDKNGQSYACPEGTIGTIENYDGMGPGGWAASGRYTSINGVVMGNMPTAVAGRVERWRMIHGGIRDTISLKIRKLLPGAPDTEGLTTESSKSYIQHYCSGPELDIPLVAADGLTMDKALVKKTVVFQPGYRWDALVTFPSAGRYCVINDNTNTSTINPGRPSVNLLGLVTVKPGTEVNEPILNYVQKKLIESAQTTIPAAMRATVERQLQNSLHLTSFTPHAPIKDTELTGKQTLAFNIAFPQGEPPKFEVDGQPYDPNDPKQVRVLTLGGADEWTLTSDFVSHPFHIHVNPFQIVSIKDPSGKEISDAKAHDLFDGSDDEQYTGLKNVWKDTLYIKNLYDGKNPKYPDAKSGQYTIVIRTRYERYIGEFVLHCHILDHEDQGMMQNVKIVLPDGNGGVAMGHH